MKILHVYKDFDPPVHGGMERHIALMCRYQREWAQVEALMCSRSRRTQRLERDGTMVTEIAEWGRFQGAPVAPTFPFYMRKLAGDVNVIHVPNPTAEIAYLLARPKGKLVVRYHSDVVRQALAMKLYGPFLMKFLRKADMIIPTSERYVETSATLQPFRERCKVISLGIVTEDYQSPDPHRVESLRSEYGGAYVLFSGRHRYYKGIEYLVRAAAHIRATVVIAGDGPERAKMMHLADQSDADIRFPGALSHGELVNHLHSCAVFAFPSVERSEAFGMSIMEAHACGKPVVATTLGTGVEFINDHKKTGLNVPPRDAEGLAAAVNTLLEDEALREGLGRYARDRIEREFHAKTVARREFELMQDLLEHT